MAILLCIDTSTTHASVALAKDEVLLAVKVNLHQKEHASFLQPAIQEMMQEMKMQLSDLGAVAVTAGPGSYTGLRVGLASAKGLCYALQIPLITISTTHVMSAAALELLKEEAVSNPSLLLCPMIDARRMEVFTALYASDLTVASENRPLILTNDSFVKVLQSNSVYFFGNGAEKWKSICKSSNAFFVDVIWNAKNMVEIAHDKYKHKTFVSLAYTVPDYGKDFNAVTK